MSLWSILGIEISSIIDSLIKGKVEQHNYLSIIDRPYGDGSKVGSRLVRLDKAVMALHLASASISVKSFGGQMRQLATRIQIGVDKAIVAKLLKVEGGITASAKRSLGVANFLTTTMDLATLEIEREANIRRKMWQARNDLFGQALPRRVRLRGRKRVPVSTRHFSRPQRKANS